MYIQAFLFHLTFISPPPFFLSHQYIDTQMPAVVPEPPPKPPVESPPPPACMMRNRWHACPELHKAMDGVTYIADHTRKEEDSTRVNYLFIYFYYYTALSSIQFFVHLYVSVYLSAYLR